MEPNFQTSFIPKKPMIEKRASAGRPFGIFAVASLFILFAVLLGTGGLYFYKEALKKGIAEKENTLTLARNRFEPSRITNLQVLDRRLRASTEILSEHIAITPVFEALSLLTMKTVRYTKFSYSLGDEKNPKVAIKMSGQAVGYRSVALQSDLYAKNRNLLDPVFSNLALDDKGNVLFDLEFTVNPSFVDYKQALLTRSNPS